MSEEKAVYQTNNLHHLVMGDVARIGDMSGDRFVERVVKEINVMLLEAGVHGIQRRFALAKFKEDMAELYRIKVEELQELTPRERYAAVEPLYASQLFDEEYNDELISVWVDLMVSGDMSVPKKVPAMLGQVIVKSDPEWAKVNLDPSVPEKNMLKNQALLKAVFEKVELL